MTHPRKQTKSHAEWKVAGLPLTIVVPYRQAERLTPLWAESEDEIPFRRQPRRACRCTLAFAAIELKRFLLRTIPDLRIQFASRPPRTGHALILEATDPASRADAFALIPERQEHLRIRGEGRTGVLFGAYAFLTLQGWGWYAPGEAGEIAPGFTDRLTVPGEALMETPGLWAGRSFDLECYSQESRDLLLWAARNRFNVWAGRAGTLALANKLGMGRAKQGRIFTFHKSGRSTAGCGRFHSLYRL